MQGSEFRKLLFRLAFYSCGKDGLEDLLTSVIEKDVSHKESLQYFLTEEGLAYLEIFSPSEEFTKDLISVIEKLTT